jgi:glycerophosphoryl diester phosphodiesterase
MKLDPERWRAPVAIAHRGSRVLWPENTDTSFLGAYEMGYRHFETDLHLTADGVLVCFHDPTVDRTTEASGRVEDFTLAELQSLDAGYRHGTSDGYAFRDSGARVPTLEWLLTMFPDVSVVVDLKCDGLARPLAELVSDLDAHDRLIVGSFSEARIGEIRQLTDMRVPVSCGPTLARLWVLASRVGRGAGGDIAALQLPARLRGVRVVDEKLVGAAHGAGLQVHVWTVNQTAEMNRFLDMGVDGLITDRPDRLKDVMIERGHWN